VDIYITRKEGEIHTLFGQLDDFRRKGCMEVDHLPRKTAGCHLQDKVGFIEAVAVKQLEVISFTRKVNDKHVESWLHPC
jgi:hypothetical protein